MADTTAANLEVKSTIAGPKVPSDALVFFGATGDLAHKKIFPALQAMVKRGNLNVPVIGVAKAGWNIEQLRERARDGIATFGGGVDEAAFAKLVGLLKYIDGDYQDPKTFEQLCTTLAGAKNPTHYLAIPPSLFATVVEGLGKSGCATNARVIIEKPFGHDLASAQHLNAILQSVSRNPEFSALTTIWARKRSKICCCSALPMLFWSLSGIATTFTASKSPWRNLSACRGAESFTTRPAPFAT